MVALSTQRGTLQEVQGRLKAHLLEGRAVSFHGHTVEGLVGALKCHVVGDEGQMSVIHLDTIHLEHTRHLLFGKTSVAG